MRDALHDDIPRQEIVGDYGAMAVIAAWAFCLFMAALVLWFGLAAVLYGMYRGVLVLEQGVKWIAGLFG